MLYLLLVRFSLTSFITGGANAENKLPPVFFPIPPSYLTCPSQQQPSLPQCQMPFVSANGTYLDAGANGIRAHSPTWPCACTCELFLLQTQMAWKWTRKWATLTSSVPVTPHCLLGNAEPVARFIAIEHMAVVFFFLHQPWHKYLRSIFPTCWANPQRFG